MARRKKWIKRFDEWGVTRNGVETLYPRDTMPYLIKFEDLFPSKRGAHNIAQHMAGKSWCDIEDFHRAASYARTVFKNQHPRKYQRILNDTGMTEKEMQAEIKAGMDRARQDQQRYAASDRRHKAALKQLTPEEGAAHYYVDEEGHITPVQPGQSNITVWSDGSVRYAGDAIIRFNP